MNERTRNYLEGRFRDHYRRNDVVPPPAPERREWGFVPWTEGGTTMVRHRSLLEFGGPGEFVSHHSPRHVYYSAGRYDDPDAPAMDAKGWRSADLVFDLDADHLPAVDPDAATYAEMLAACKDALLRLLDILERDFGFADPEVVFSGNRGYHVHVRDPSVAELGREARREVVDYVRAVGVTFEDLVERRASGTATRRVLRTDGGWGRRVHERLVDYAESVAAMDRADALAELRELPDVGDRRAERIYETVTDDGGDPAVDALAAGNLERGGRAIRTLARVLAERTTTEESAPIDEPVTTDLNRLIRLPGSLHGASGLVVRPVDRADLREFDPLTDAVAGTFEGHEIAVEVTDGGEVELGGDRFTLEDGVTSLPEYVGVFLMARGRAEKVEEGP